MDLGLRERVCVVTGSTGGIGRETAKLLCEEGARVVVTGRSAERGEQAKDEVGAALGLRFDPADPSGPGALIAETTATLGSPDVLVNNVGHAYQTSFDELSDDQWEELWQLNGVSSVRGVRAVLPAMRERRRGAIVNLASSAGKRPSTSMPNYSVTKAAVLSVSRLRAGVSARGGGGPAGRPRPCGPAGRGLWQDPGRGSSCGRRRAAAGSPRRARRDRSRGCLPVLGPGLVCDRSGVERGRGKGG